MFSTFQQRVRSFLEKSPTKRKTQSAPQPITNYWPRQLNAERIHPNGRMLSKEQIEKIYSQPLPAENEMIFSDEYGCYLINVSGEMYVIADLIADNKNTEDKIFLLASLLADNYKVLKQFHVVKDSKLTAVKNEHALLKKMQKTAFPIINPTGSKYHFIISDYEAGYEIQKLIYYRRTADRPESTWPDLMWIDICIKIVDAGLLLEKNNILHLDVWGRNIIYDPFQQKATLIDFGRAAETTKTAEEKLAPIVLPKFYHVANATPPEHTLQQGNSYQYTSAMTTFTFGKTLRNVAFAENHDGDLKTKQALQELFNQMEAPKPADRKSLKEAREDLTAIFTAHQNAHQNAHPDETKKMQKCQEEIRAREQQRLKKFEEQIKKQASLTCDSFQKTMKLLKYLDNPATYIAGRIIPSEKITAVAAMLTEFDREHKDTTASSYRQVIKTVESICDRLKINNQLTAAITLLELPHAPFLYRRALIYKDLKKSKLALADLNKYLEIAENEPQDKKNNAKFERVRISLELQENPEIIAQDVPDLINHYADDDHKPQLIKAHGWALTRLNKVEEAIHFVCNNSTSIHIADNLREIMKQIIAENSEITVDKAIKAFKALAEKYIDFSTTSPAYSSLEALLKYCSDLVLAERLDDAGKLLAVIGRRSSTFQRNYDSIHSLFIHTKRQCAFKRVMALWSAPKQPSEGQLMEEEKCLSLAAIAKEVPDLLNHYIAEDYNQLIQAQCWMLTRLDRVEEAIHFACIKSIGYATQNLAAIFEQILTENHSSANEKALRVFSALQEEHRLSAVKNQLARIFAVLEKICLHSVLSKEKLDLLLEVFCLLSNKDKSTISYANIYKKLMASCCLLIKNNNQLELVNEILDHPVVKECAQSHLSYYDTQEALFLQMNKFDEAGLTYHLLQVQHANSIRSFQKLLAQLKSKTIDEFDIPKTIIVMLKSKHRNTEIELLTSMFYHYLSSKIMTLQGQLRQLEEADQAEESEITADGEVKNSCENISASIALERSIEQSLQLITDLIKQINPILCINWDRLSHCQLPTLRIQLDRVEYLSAKSLIAMIPAFNLMKPIKDNNQVIFFYHRATETNLPSSTPIFQVHSYRPSNIL